MSANLPNLHFNASPRAENIFKTSEWFLATRQFIQAIPSLKWLIVAYCLFIKMGIAESYCNRFFLINAFKIFAYRKILF
jgi:hypothetical protein